MSRYRGPHLKKHVVWGLYRDLLEKSMRPELSLERHCVLGKNLNIVFV